MVWVSSTEIIFSASVKLPTYEKACNDIPFATPNDDEQNNTDDAPQQVNLFLNETDQSHSRTGP